MKYERHPENSAVLNIDVTDEHRNRAYKFIHYFIEMVQAIIRGTVLVDSRNNDNTVWLSFFIMALLCVHW